MTALAPTLQAFFTDRLVRERHASPATVAAYRDTWRMLLDFAATRTRKSPIRLDLDDNDATMVSAFLDHLETHRGNTARTRNARLAGIHSVFRFAAHRHPEHTATIARVLAIPTKRFDRAIITYLTPAEVAALLAAPDLSTWFGRRDQAWLQTAAQTGLRISEMTALTCANVHLGVGAHVSCLGKGRKQRITPLTAGTVTILMAWINERGHDPAGPLFPTRTGRPMSRDAVEHRHRRPHRHRRRGLPEPEPQNGDGTHPAAYGGNAASRGRNGHEHHFALARSRAGPNDHRLSARRPRHQGTSPGPYHTPGRQARPVPAPGPAPRLPRITLTMPTLPGCSPTPATGLAPPSA